MGVLCINYSLEVFSPLVKAGPPRTAEKGVSAEERPAAMAGLLKGDVVVQLGDSTVTDMMSYMRALSAFEEGDTANVIVERKGKKIAAQVKF